MTGGRVARRRLARRLRRLLPGRRRARETSLAVVVDRSFRVVIVGSVALVLVVATLLAWLSLVSQPHVARLERALSAIQAEHTAMLDQETSLRGFVSTDDLSFMLSYARARGDMERADHLLQTTGGDGAMTQAIVDLRLAQQRWVSEWAQVAAGGRAPGRVGSDERTSFLLRDKVLFDQYGDARATAVDVTTDRLTASRDDQSRALMLVAAAAVLTAVAIFGAAVRRRRRLRRDVLVPVNAVLDGLEAVGHGSYDQQVRAEGARELVDVVDGLNRMTARLADARDRAAAREQHIVEQAERLRSILAMVREIGGSLNLDYVVDAVAAGVARIVGAGQVAIWLTSPEGGELVESCGSRGRDGCSTSRPPVELGSGPVGRAAKYSRVVREDVDGGQRLVVPLVVGSRVVGVLDLQLASPEPLTDAMVEVLETLAVHSATAVEAARLHEDAAHASEHDALTQLPNRRRLDADLALECERSSRYARPLAFIMLDLDHFKRINDDLGHTRGDEVLQTRGRRHQQRAAGLRHRLPVRRRGAGHHRARERPARCAAARRPAARTHRDGVRRRPGEVVVTASFGVAELGPGTGCPPRSSPRPMPRSTEPSARGATACAPTSRPLPA